MKKMKTKNKCLVTSLAIIAMLMMSLGVKAQDVLIDPESGNVVSTVTNREETGFALGLGAETNVTKPLFINYIKHYKSYTL